MTGVDFSTGALAIAKGESTGANPAYRLESIFEMSDEAAFDIAFAWGVIAEACRGETQLVDVLTRIHRALRPGGRLLLTEPIHKGFLHRVLDMDLTTFLSVLQRGRVRGPVDKADALLAGAPVALVRDVAGLDHAPGVFRIGQTAMRLPVLSDLGDYWSILAIPPH